MKKTICMVLALVMMMCGTITAFANDYSTYAEAAFVNNAAERFSERTGVSVNVTDYQIEEDDNFKTYSIFVQPIESARSGNVVIGYGLTVWQDKESGDDIGDIYATAHFECNSSSAIVLEYYPQAGNMHPNASYTIKSQKYANSTAFTKAYYKFSYTFKYFNKGKDATIEVNCTKNGIIGGTSDFKDIAA